MQNAPRALAIITCVTFALCGGAWAQESTDQASKLAKAAQNPLAAMTTPNPESRIPKRSTP